MNQKIWLSSPHMGGTEQKYIKEAFKSNWIAPLGPHVDQFERELAHYTRAKYVAALSSGTAALHLALIILGVKRGDEVICQSLTFSATANPIAYLGAIPIFIDSEKETMNMCPELLRKAIEERLATKKKPAAIIPVHLYGMPAKMDQIMAIANEYGIPVVEDAAEALGSTLHTQHTGTFGTMAALSFNGNKIITTSGGGALISNQRIFIEKARFLATQARDPAPHYQHSQIGYNYRMSNISASLGLGQMEVLDQHIQKHRVHFETYKKAFAAIPAIQFLDEPAGYYSNRWLSTIHLDPKERKAVPKETIIKVLESDNIESRPLWKPMHLQPIFKDCPAYLNGNSEELFLHGLCLPSGSNLLDNEIERVITGIRSCF